VNKLRMLVFDVEVLNKFYPEDYDLEEYATALKEVIVRNNESALETIGIALKFIKEHDYKDILYYWSMLEYLSQQELEAQSRINDSIDALMPRRLVEKRRIHTPILD
jgi:hypothetical protein